MPYGDKRGNSERPKLNRSNPFGGALAAPLPITDLSPQMMEWRAHHSSTCGERSVMGSSLALRASLPRHCRIALPIRICLSKERSACPVDGSVPCEASAEP